MLAMISDERASRFGQADAPETDRPHHDGPGLSAGACRPSAQAIALAEAFLLDFWGKPAIDTLTVTALRPLSLEFVPELLDNIRRSGRKCWWHKDGWIDHQWLGLVLAAHRLGYLECGNGRDFSRIRATPAFLALAARHDISPQNARLHFPPTKIREKVSEQGPLYVKEARRSGHGIRIGGAIAIDNQEETARRLIIGIDKFSEFLGEQRVEPFGATSFERTFFQLEGEPLQWDRGGRIAAQGARNFQQASARARRRITINGESIVEIDVVACGLSIAHALTGTPIDLSVDPYVFDGLPRKLIKAFIVEKFGPHGLPRAWRWEIARELRFRNEKALQEAYPIKSVRRKIRQRFPLLSDPVDWTKIQFLESQALWTTITTLAFDHGIPALPVHDSIIIPVSQVDLAGDVLSRCFRSIVGCSPRLRFSAANMHALEEQIHTA
ncbi:hypothetical protein [Sphingomonas colocasiae]|uniref:DNA-directed DNA polymerase family A palm domain-containing protein n=1 Tax=Sphingomonas colocasiae TaxID=1848973 RepID=A0ABS7PN28_9SPHN|nr:hypothetical protein [Sphingomonas colocasiae]MBY8821852.1 hypothetical protein [Sphingomonas colocasiae]